MVVLFHLYRSLSSILPSIFNNLLEFLVNLALVPSFASVIVAPSP